MELKPGYKQTEVGLIPEDWRLSKLSEVCAFENGDRGINYPSPGSFVHSGIPFVNAGHLQNGIISTREMDYITPRAFERLGSGKFTPGDILFCLRGSLGKYGIVDSKLITGAIASSLVIVKARKPLLSSEFLGFYFASRLCSQMIETWAGGAAQPNLGARDLGRFVIAIPPPHEQDKIASVLADIERNIFTLSKLIQKKRQIKQAAMQELLTGKRRLPGFEGEWKEVSLGSVASMNSGGTPPTGRDDFYGGGIPWVSISDMTSGGKFISQTERTLTATGLANCAAKQFPAGTILYAMYASLGECSIAATEVTSSQAILGIRPGASLHNEFLFYYLSSIHEKVKLMGQQGTQSNLNKRIVQGFTLRMPDKAEQIAIAEALGEIDDELNALSMKSQKIGAMKAGMMQKLLTGKIRLT